MDYKSYLKASVLNLALIGVGALIVPSVVTTGERFSTVHAQEPKAPAQERTPQADSRFEYVNPSLSTGNVAFHTILAHRVAADNIMVNDFELLKIHENTLNTLVRKNYLSKAEVERIVADSKAQRPLRLQESK